MLIFVLFEILLILFKIDCGIQWWITVHLNLLSLLRYHKLILKSYGISVWAIYIQTHWFVCSGVYLDHTPLNHISLPATRVLSGKWNNHPPPRPFIAPQLLLTSYTVISLVLYHLLLPWVYNTFCILLMITPDTIVYTSWRVKIRWLKNSINKKTWLRDNQFVRSWTLNSIEMVDKHPQSSWTTFKKFGITSDIGLAHRTPTNSVSKWFGQTLLGWIWSQMVQTRLPLSLWVELAMYCSIQINNTPSQALDLKSPHNVFTSLSPTHHPTFDVTQLKPFGFLCVVYDRAIASEVSPTAQRPIFVGLQFQSSMTMGQKDWLDFCIWWRHF